MTSGEFVDLVTAFVPPLLVVAISGLWLQRLKRDLETSRWANQKVIERRIAVYDEVAPPLNDLLCYFTWVGNWKELTPPKVIAIKRQLDKRMYTDRFLFSGTLFGLYSQLMRLCFDTYTGAGENAKICTAITSVDGDRRQASAEPWDGTWDAMFSQRPERRESVRHAYEELMTTFSVELGILTRRSVRKKHVAPHSTGLDHGPIHRGKTTWLNPSPMMRLPLGLWPSDGSRSVECPPPPGHHTSRPLTAPYLPMSAS